MLDDFDIKTNKAVFSPNATGGKSTRIAIPPNFFKDIGVDEENRDVKIINLKDGLLLINAKENFDVFLVSRLLDYVNIDINSILKSNIENIDEIKKQVNNLKEFLDKIDKI